MIFKRNGKDIYLLNFGGERIRDYQAYRHVLIGFAQCSTMDYLHDYLTGLQAWPWLFILALVISIGK